MSLAVKPVFEAKLLEFNQAQGNERFQAQFLTACNRAIQEINVECDPETAITNITSTEQDIDALDAVHEPILSAGITAHLIGIGVGTERMNVERIDRAWERAKADFWAYAAMENQSDVDDDGQPEEDIVGLGHLD